MANPAENPPLPGQLAAQGAPDAPLKEGEVVDNSIVPIQTPEMLAAAAANFRASYDAPELDPALRCMMDEQYWFDDTVRSEHEKHAVAAKLLGVPAETLKQQLASSLMVQLNAFGIPLDFAGHLRRAGSVLSHISLENHHNPDQPLTFADVTADSIRASYEAMVHNYPEIGDKCSGIGR